MSSEKLLLRNLAQLLDQSAAAISETIDRTLDSVREKTPVQVDHDRLAGAIPREVIGIVIRDIPPRLLAIRFAPKQPITNLHSAWIVRAIHEAERRCDCQVGIEIDGVYVHPHDQFPQLGQEIRLVSFGEDPAGALRYVVSEDDKFDPELFDQDGYTRAG